MTILQTIATLPTWFTVSQLAHAVGINRQKARHALAKLYKDGLVEKRTVNPHEAPNLWRTEWIITRKGMDRTA